MRKLAFFSALIASGPALGTLRAESAAVLTATPPASTASPVGHYKDVHGLHMYYEIHGTGVPLLVLHGGLSCIALWPEPIDYFSKNYQVIAPEQTGHGHTADDPREPLNYHAMAENTAELLGQLHINKVYIIGWSDGGIVALDLAIHHPDLLYKIAISGANYDPMAPTSPEDALKPGPDDLPKVLRDNYEKFSPDGVAHWPDFVARVRTLWQTQPNFSTAQLASIKTPTLVIAGDRDDEAPEYTVKMWHLIPKAELWIAPNSTHLHPKDQPQRFNETVAAFFQEKDGAEK